MKWKSLFAAALSAAVTLPAWAQDATGGGIPFTYGRSISVNFATGRDGVTNNVSGDTAFGLADVAVAGAQWDNITGASATNQALKVSGATSGATLTFSAGATWSLDSTALDNTNALLGSFLDDGTAITVGEDSTTFAAEITVAGIPFEHYDVYLYSNVNNGSGFKPIQVNGSYYTYADGATVSTEDTSEVWGATAQTTPQLGQNVLIVPNVAGDALTIRTLKRGVVPEGQGTGNTPRGSFAGFQIVERVPPTISVNFIGANNITSIKAKAGFSGLIGVANADWNEGVSNETGGSANNAETDMALVDNQGGLTTATLTYAMGGAWSAGTNTNRDALLGEMGKGYCDNPTTENTVDLSLRNVPYTSYSLILYYGTDKTSTSIPWSAPKVTDAEGVSKWYSYPADYEGDAAQASETEVASWGTVSTKTGVYGDDVMLIENLSGDIDIDLGVRRDDGIYGSLCGFQIVCTGEVIPVDPAKKGVISLNFGSDRREVQENATTYGLVPVAGAKWQNFSGESGTDVPIKRAENTDLSGAPTVTYTSEITWYTGTNDAHPFLQGYLDDGATSDGDGATISVANLPYSAYDVIVYAGYSDNGEDNIQPYEIDGTFYRWDDAKRTTVATTDTTAAASWGSLSATPAYGANALRVRGCLRSPSSLSVKGLDRNGDERGGIAALQIVERKLITADFANALDALAEDTPVYIMPMLMGTIDGDLTLPADAVLDLRYVTWDNPVVSGTLTLGANTMIRLPGGRVDYAVAGSLAGETASVQVFVHDDPADTVGQLADGVTISGGTITRPATYEWTGNGADNNWSTDANWSSGVMPDETSAVTVTLAADDAKTIVIDTAEATANLFYISGPQTGSATLEIVAAENVEGAHDGQRHRHPARQCRRERYVADGRRQFDSL